MFDPIAYAKFRLPDWRRVQLGDYMSFWPARFPRDAATINQWIVYVHETMSREEVDDAIDMACKRAGLHPRPHAAWVEK